VCGYSNRKRLFPLHFLQHPPDGADQERDVAPANIKKLFGVCVEISMCQHIADTDDIAPWDFRITREEFPLCPRVELPKRFSNGDKNHTNAVEMFPSRFVTKIIGDSNQLLHVRWCAAAQIYAVRAILPCNK